MALLLLGIPVTISSSRIHGVLRGDRVAMSTSQAASAASLSQPPTLQYRDLDHRLLQHQPRRPVHLHRPLVAMPSVQWSQMIGVLRIVPWGSVHLTFAHATML